ncbi:excinuclease ABC subunit UvrA [Paenibacillus sp. LC231]|uniref:ATP-binding cassette domain-containing protein n=1 Tax=Paenibacillus sp. LC231 TaxID=1120679 RepID=UPI001F1F5AA4|nr:excinuclease ABC subunit UvrA [Paenibacillus sp. LC231]
MMCNPMEQAIKVNGARNKNLRNVSLSIPKKQITVFTGVSGSGKSAMVFDTITAESQRQLNETYSSFIRHRLPHYGQPEVDSVENLSVAIVVNQKRIGGNARSTVGTITDIHSLLRLLFSRIGRPFVGYSDFFSFNNPQGMCPHCEGLGKVNSFRIENLIDKEKSLNEGPIRFPTFRPGEFRWKRYVATGLFDNDKKLKDYTEEEWDTLLYKTGFKPPNPTEEWPPTSYYEGIIPRLERTFLSKDSRDARTYREAIDQVVAETACPLCHGGRLNQEVLSCKINGTSIADCARMQVNELIAFLQTIEDPAAATIVDTCITRLEQLLLVGIGYLTMDRETATLSGGESQRIKMVRQLGSSLTDLTYIFDEPSIGLHPHDVHNMNRLLQQLRDKGNTVIIVEHDPDVIRIADYIVDMGPRAGTAGGTIVYEGDPEGLRHANTLTGKYLSQRARLKSAVREPAGWLRIKDASLHNLKQVSVSIPAGVLTVVTGVAGSGKSTLINQVLPNVYPEAIIINQDMIQASNRSNIATFTGIFDAIRKLFADENRVSPSLFSFNAKGACPVCNGSGTITMDLAFMDSLVTVCEACQGRRFHDDVLRYQLRGRNISDVLAMTTDEALDYFTEQGIVVALQRIQHVGLGYLTLGQPLSTLSGGERQRVKLAAELDKQGEIYVLDEPSTGLHLSDCERLMSIINRLVAQNSTVIVIEHNLDIISQADWIIDMGPGAGHDGGNVLFSGKPADLLNNPHSLTARYLRLFQG